MSSSWSFPASRSGFTVAAGERKFPDGRIGPANTPFCKVCYDAGLSADNYNSHFVKDQPGANGKVVCPTLLAQKCLMCGHTGHTSSYCSQKKQQDADRAEREREERDKAKKSNGGWETVGAAANSKPKPRIEDLKPKTGAVAVAGCGGDGGAQYGLPLAASAQVRQRCRRN